TLLRPTYPAAPAVCTAECTPPDQPSPRLSGASMPITLDGRVITACLAPQDTPHATSSRSWRGGLQGCLSDPCHDKFSPRLAQATQAACRCHPPTAALLLSMLATLFVQTQRRGNGHIQGLHPGRLGDEQTLAGFGQQSRTDALPLVAK